MTWLERRDQADSALRVALETRHPEAFDALTTHQRARVRDMAAAAARLLHDIDISTIATWCGSYAEPGHRDDQRPNERVAREHIAKGRERLSRFGAWPWACFDRGALPKDWHEVGDAYADAAFEEWCRVPFDRVLELMLRAGST